MHTIEINTYKRKFQGEFLKYKKDYPENWNELTVKQLLFIAFLMNKGYNLEKLNVMIIKNFLNIKNRYFFDISGEAMSELAKSISFIHETKTLTSNKIPEINIKINFFSWIFTPRKRKCKLYGPSDGLLTLTFEQFFGHCEPALNDYVKTKNISSLDYLVASLYTYKKEKFIPDDIEEILKKVKKLNLDYKVAILLFYIGCKDFFAYKFQKLFKTEKSSSNKQISDLHFIELTDQLNNEDLSNNEQIKKTNIIDAFIRLTRMIEKYEQLKRMKK